MKKYKQIIPRPIREKLGILKEFFLLFINSDKSKRKALKSYFKKTGTIFIHIPKCAGTSVALSLYNVDPWHFSVKQFSDKDLEKYTVFAIIRDPVDRLISSYKYLCEKSKNYPNSIYSDVSMCNSFDEFVHRFVLNKTDEERNYFLRSQYWYLSKNGVLKSNFLISIDHIDEDFPEIIKKQCGYKGNFPKKNISKSSEFFVSKDLVEKIQQAYEKDYKYILNNDYKS